MIIDGKEINAETGYANGYKTGYEWLGVKRSSNPLGFKHPSEKGGYIPGGPGNLFYKYLTEKGLPSSYMYTGKINPKWAAQDEYNKAWRKGFIDGINAYVTKNALDYPILSHE